MDLLGVTTATQNLGPLKHLVEHTNDIISALNPRLALKVHSKNEME